MTTILILAAFVLLLFLSIQFLQAEDIQKNEKHTWFSNSKLNRGKWRWWRWIIIIGAAAIFILIVLRTLGGFSYKHMISLSGLLLLHQLGMRFINRRSSSVWRLVIEFLLVFTLLGVFYLRFLPAPSEGIIAPNGDVSLQKVSWQSMLQYIALYSILLIFILHLIRYNLVLWQKEKLNKELKINRLKQELNLAQLEMLQARINPHFLYNALNSIAGLALSDGENTRRMALSLSRFFSYCTDTNSTHLIPVVEEFEVIKTYLDIEKIRFGERLEFQIISEKEIDHFLLPRMLLQPLVENCVKHGMGGGEEVLQITIQVTPSNEGIHIAVKDNGLPFPNDLIPGYGLKSIYDKLDILFPNNYEIELHNIPEKEIRIQLMNKKQA